MHQHDMRVRFVQILGNSETGHGTKVVIEEKGAVTMSHDTAYQFRHALERIIDRNIPTSPLDEISIEDIESLNNPKIAEMLKNLKLSAE